MNYSKKINTYGLTPNDLQETQKKIQKQNDFLETNFYVDEINGLIKQLKDFVVSRNINPNRYYAQIQNQVNTLCSLALLRGLVPIFMTITLPSRYHKYKTTKSGKLILNPKYDGFTTPKEANKLLTDKFTSLRNDRAMRKDNISANDRMFIRSNEPHKSGTPHTHILYFVPEQSVERIEKAFKRLFNKKGNDIQTTNIKNPVSYIIKYILKVLITTKKDIDISESDRYLNAWYSHNKIRLFSCSRSLIPLYIYKKISQHLDFYDATYYYKEQNRLLIDKENIKIKKIDFIYPYDTGELYLKNLFIKNYNFSIMKIHNVL